MTAGPAVGKAWDATDEGFALRSAVTVLFAALAKAQPEAAAEAISRLRAVARDATPGAASALLAQCDEWGRLLQAAVGEEHQRARLALARSRRPQR